MRKMDGNSWKATVLSQENLLIKPSLPDVSSIYPFISQNKLDDLEFQELWNCFLGIVFVKSACDNVFHTHFGN